MYIAKQQDLLMDIAHLIEKEATGTPEELAERFGLTDKMLRRYITHLRAMGADIGYCTARNTYYFVKPLTFKFGFSPLETSKAH
jgi:predicted DNA-binding transcriptional regulator YafY